MSRVAPSVAGVYLLFSITVYFGTLGGDAHSWWPAFLYPIVWPLGKLEHDVLAPALAHWLGADGKNVPEATWIAMDRVSGAFYVLAGTMWVWCIAALVVRALMALRGHKR